MPVAPEFVTAVGDDAINRFDEARKKKKKKKSGKGGGQQGNKPRNGNGGQGSGRGKKQGAPKEKSAE